MFGRRPIPDAIDVYTARNLPPFSGSAQDRAIIMTGDLNEDPFKNSRFDSAKVMRFAGALRRCGGRFGAAAARTWSFANLDNPAKRSRIDHVLHTARLLSARRSISL
ncbi:endonuclease/exonuclease/phosphatase family protein [Mycobacterium intracellulare]|uniref:endonuclease/exonuclease/phosphatase family protein n=1 Tax=Mycobacterium intracellulare TaxID=1767 RepID=UPI003364D56D